MPAPRSTGRRFETGWLNGAANLSVLTDLYGAWVARVRLRNMQTTIVLEMDSSVNQTHDAQDRTADNGHFARMRYHPLFAFNQFSNPKRGTLRSGNVHAAAERRSRSSLSGLRQ